MYIVKHPQWVVSLCSVGDAFLFIYMTAIWTTPLLDDAGKLSGVGRKFQFVSRASKTVSTTILPSNQLSLTADQ